ncbi:MAG: thioredoxin domain-containing protein [Sphingomicrobium sp.]
MSLRFLTIFPALFLAAASPAQRSESDAMVSPQAGIQKSDFFKPGIAPARVPARYDVTIVYFFDYQCPQCRRFTPDVERVMREDPRVRWIYRDIPSISPKSRDAARVAIAASFQNRHHAFHHALMISKGRLSDATIRVAATRAKIDWPRLHQDLKKRGKQIDDLIDHNMALADTAGIVGTPAFLVGETLADGALDYRNLKLEIADARKAARR